MPPSGRRNLARLMAVGEGETPKKHRTTQAAQGRHRAPHSSAETTCVCVARSAPPRAPTQWRQGALGAASPSGSAAAAAGAGGSSSPPNTKKRIPQPRNNARPSRVSHPGVLGSSGSSWSTCSACMTQRLLGAEPPPSSGSRKAGTRPLDRKFRLGLTFCGSYNLLWQLPATCFCAPLLSGVLRA